MGRLILFLFLLSHFCSRSQSQLTSFRLVNDKKIIKVDSGQLLELYINPALNNGSNVNRKITGFFKYFEKDNISLTAVLYKDKFISEKKTVHHWASDNNKDTIVNFKIADLNEVVTVNRKLEKSMPVFAIASLVSGIVVSPLASIQDGKINWTQVKKISGISAGGLCLSLVISGTCWDRHYRLKKTARQKSVWMLEQ